MLGYTHLNNYKRVKIIESLSPDHKETKLEISNVRYLKLDNTFL